MDKLRGVVAKIFVFVLFGLLILSFAIWGVGDMLRQGGDAPVVAEVGDQQIEEQVFRRELNETMSILSQRVGNQIDMQMAEALGLPRQVLQRLVTEKLITAEAARLNLEVTDDQLREAIYANPAFQNAAGQFDRARFEQTLFQARLNEAGYLADLREQLLQQQLGTALGAAVAAPDLMAETLYRRQAEQRRADWVTLALADQPEAALPDEAELESFYEERKDSFMAPAYRALSYLWLQPEDLFDEITLDEAELREEYDSNLAAYAEPERRTLEQGVYDSREAAEAAWQRVQGGEDFAAVVQDTLGSPPASLGTVMAEDLPAALREPAFGLAEPGVAPPVESGFGWHLLRVTDIQAGENPSFEEVRPEIEKALKRRDAVEALVSIINQLDDELAGGATLEEAAQRLDLEVRSIPAIDRQGRAPDGTTVGSLPQPERFLAQAFETPVGEQSLVQETDQGDYFLVRVESEQAAAPKPFESVRDQVAQLWQQEQKQARAWERADALKAALEEGQTLEAVAEREGLQVTQGQPVRRDAAEPSQALVGALFDAEAGSVVVAEGPNGPLVAVLREVIEADPAKAPQEIASIRETLQQRLRGDLFDLYLRALEQTHGVRVYEARIQQMLTGL